MGAVREVSLGIPTSSPRGGEEAGRWRACEVSAGRWIVDREAERLTAKGRGKA